MSYHAYKLVIDGHTDTHTDTRATTIPEGQNLPRVKRKTKLHNSNEYDIVAWFSNYVVLAKMQI